jgi:hypothetical protein
VERSLGIITQRAIRRGSFSSVKELIAKIEQFVAAYNKTKAPFNWPPSRTQSWRSSSDFARKTPGRHTSVPSCKFIKKLILARNWRVPLRLRFQLSSDQPRGTLGLLRL